MCRRVWNSRGGKRGKSLHMPELSGEWKLGGARFAKAGEMALFERTFVPFHYPLEGAMQHLLV